jgi:transglutaminase-like putative cysteine protease
VSALRISSNQSSAHPKLIRELDQNKLKSVGLAMLMLFSTIASIEFVSFTALASTDQDGDGLTYGLEYLINTQPNDWDSDNDQLPDGWEWQYGLDPLSSSNNDGAIGDPDGDGFSNLQEYNYLQPSNWDLSSSTSELDNGVWWNGTVPVSDWDEENAMQYNQLACGDAGSDGSGSVILCDEDPVGNICTDGFDNDKDGMVDSADNDFDGDADCATNDDDGDGVYDEDPDGWDTDGDGMPDGWEASNGLNATSASNADGANGDPDGDGLINLYEYINPSWTTTCGGQPCYRPGPSGSFTETTSPCAPHLGIGPGGCATMTAETDSVTSTNPLDSDTDGDGLNDSYEALTLLTDPTNADTDADGINDGTEINGQYGNPAQASDPRNNNTDGDAFDDGDEDQNGNGLVDANETDPTRREDSGDFDNDGLENWQENLSCTSWNVADTDSGGINDGDESNASHGTDPCDSLIQFTSTIVSYNSGSSQLTLTDASGLRPNGGIAFYNSSGSYTQFTYASVVNSVLQGVFVTPPSGASIESRNNSWCHDISGGSFPNYCDDDYSDSDGDGLADWEETLGVYGYFSNPTLADSDGDGVIDYDEVMSGTDPMEPCDNTLDDDGDGLNNYFEVSTGCDNSWIGITNGSQDIWSTDDDNSDTDSGGVNDKQEYFDSTNPESDPTDDILPEDFDGDGVPDAVENQTGTDWRNPDTDGGGMLDGDECPQQFWFTNCQGSPFNPWDPSDDSSQNEVVFWSNNTSGVVDLNRVHRWRVHTYDFYTGAAYGLETDVHPFSDISVPYTNMTHLASSNYANSTVAWNIAFANPIMSGKVPMSAYQFNITFWADASLAIARSNDTHSYGVTGGLLTEMWVEEYEYWFDWSTLAPNTIAGTNSSYETILPPQFSNSSLPESLVMNITNDVISAAGATDAYSKADAIATFLRDGNATYDFKRNYNGSGSAPEADVSYELLNRAKEGTCSEFTSVFVTMARTAGLPARFVTGYSGGSWNGNGYSVYGANLNQWGEVRLELSPGSGGDDLGWIPFEACPDPEEIEVVNLTWTPTTYDRNGLVEMNVSGTLQYVENVTAIPDITLRGFVVSTADVGDVPGPAASVGNLFGTITTDSNGNFAMNGTMTTPAAPGYASIVLEHIQNGYVSHDGLDLGVFVNMTDDSNISHSSPGPVDSPVVGAGATTVLSGQLLFVNNDTSGAENIGPLTVWLDFTSSEDGATNLSGTVGPSGVWEINVTLDELETKSNISATLGFSGWQDTSQSFGGPQFHLRPSTHSITLDIRDAPNLTATIEGPGLNNSILQIDELVYLNGSAMSFGAVPSALSGNLSFGMRELNGGGTFIELFNQSVNGSFAISHILDINTTFVKAGEIELSLVFYPDSLNATDALNTSGSPWWLQGLLFLELQAQSQLRGNPVGIIVQVTDHLGGELDLNLSGNFTFDFDGSTENTTTDPGSSTLSPTFSTSSNLNAGDYPFDMFFDGNMYYLPSSNSSTLRIMGTIDVTVTVINDWTYLGNTTWIVGDITDDISGAAVLGNDSIIMVQLLTEFGPIDLANGLLNNTTGTYNITITAPNNLPSGVYDLEIMTDFGTPSQPGGPYYEYVDAATPPALPQMPSTTWGIESDVVLETPEGQVSDIIAVMNSSVNINVWVGDIADNSNVSGAQVNYILDYGGANISIGSAASAVDGNATLVWTVTGVDPGQYLLRMEVIDDLSSPKIAGATRHYGNFTEINVTVQVPSNIRVDSIPSTITAGVNFQVMGQVEDGDNTSRNLTTAVALEMFWLDNPDEKLVNNVYTSINGSFNLSVPTDVLNNGTLRGARTFVISVVEGSSAFYLTDTSNHSILVQGVTLFENMQPLNPIVVNRGEDVNMTLQMVESSNMWQPLGGYTIDVRFDETWLTSNTTDSQGRTSFAHTIPFDQPLGLISISFYYNGSVDLIPAQRNLSTVTVRSVTIMVVDPIVANPIAGDSFTVTGTIESDNGSGLQLRNGAALSASVLFLIDGEPTGFTLSNGQIQANGSWEATIALGSGFMAGTHIAEAQYIPSVNYYSGSNANQSFDSRGYTTLNFLSPSLDGVNQPSLNDRTDRGDDVNARLQLMDNTGAPVVGVQVTVTLNGTAVTTIGTTDSSGLIDVNLTTPVDLVVGFHNLDAEFLGTSGSTGLVGDNTSILFVVLAQTEVNITESSSAIIAGDLLYVNGTLLDDLGNPLQIDGVDSIAVVYLLIDGVPVSSVQSNAGDGMFMFAWVSPENIAAGPHSIQVSFTGGRDWVDPIGEGDSANPEYYQASVDSVNFTVAVPTKILLLTPGGQVDREDTLTVQGRLLDLVDNPLEGETIEVWLGGIFLTNVTTTADGSFTAIHPVPADAALGPVLLETKFNGTLQFLPSTNNGTWNIYSNIFVDISVESPLAVEQMTTIDGFVGDNQLIPLPNMVVLISIEGISIGNATTDANGNFSFDWQVPNIFTDGEHVVIADVPAQEWYRAGSGNTTFFLAHRTGLSIDIEDNDATRNDFWEVSGTLYDIDTALNDGLAGETVLIYIDGSQVDSVITSINGEFTTSIRAESSFARGSHTMTFSFAGSSGHLPVDSNSTVLVWADVIVQIDSVVNYVVRGDGISYPIQITGRVTEIGGQGVTIDGAELVLGEGADCGTSGSEDSRCITSNIIWNGGSFTLTAIAPSWMEPGPTQLWLQAPTNSSLYLRSGEIWTNSMAITIDATFDVDIEPIIEDEQEVVMGEITVTADDTDEGIEGIEITVYLEYENGTRIDQLTLRTDSDGFLTFEFNAETPYGDYSEYGEVNLKMTVSSNGILSTESVNSFNNEYSSGQSPDYTFADDSSGMPWWVYIVAILIIGAGAAFVIMRRRAEEAAKEIADIFSYTAELLAAGDSMREAIFQCYESLVHVLMGRGFLRRDFETVREFEMAIRAALPQLSENALNALDNVFEEARYSRHEMGESHKANAQEALTRVVNELGQFTDIPNR